MRRIAKLRRWLMRPMSHTSGERDKSAPLIPSSACGGQPSSGLHSRASNVIVAAQLQILLAWLAAGGVVLGLGLAARAPVTRASDLWSAFWLGFGVLLALLQLWHL